MIPDEQIHQQADSVVTTLAEQRTQSIVDKQDNKWMRISISTRQSIVATEHHYLFLSFICGIVILTILSYLGTGY